MKAIITRRGYQIEKDSISKNEIEKLKKDLYVTKFSTFAGGKNDPEESFSLYREGKKYIIIPRFYGISKYGLVENIMKGDTVDIKFKGKLRDKQVPIVEKCMNDLLKYGGGVLTVGCGEGKTIMGLNIASQLKARTLIIVPKTFLLCQWRERIEEFIPDCSVGKIQSDVIDINKDIVIGIVNSVSMIDYDLSIFGKFKLVIFDEAHHYCSKMFSNSLYRCGANYVLSLSATPYRIDKLEKVLFWYSGKMIYEMTKKPDDNVVAKIFTYKSKSNLFEEKLSYKQGKMTPDNVKMTTNIISIKSRNDHILNIINILRRDPKRKILVLSHRISHLEYLKEKLDEFIKKDIENGLIEKDSCVTAFYIGGKKNQQEREKAENNSDIIVGTVNLSEEGLDLPFLNTIILATSKKNVVQSIGRILRNVLQVGSVRPLIIDISDSLSIYRNHKRLRTETYKGNDYIIENYDLDDVNVYQDKKIITMEKALETDLVKEVKTKKDNRLINVIKNKTKNCSDSEENENDNECLFSDDE